MKFRFFFRLGEFGAATGERVRPEAVPRGGPRDDSRERRELVKEGGEKIFKIKNRTCRTLTDSVRYGKVPRTIGYKPAATSLQGERSPPNVRKSLTDRFYCSCRA